MECPSSLGNVECHPTSVLDFLQSGRLSNSHLTLQHGCTAATRTAAVPPSMGPTAYGECNNSGGGDNLSQRQLIMENAARVSLLLTRSFIRFCQLSRVSHDDSHHPSIELGDFHINFSLAMISPTNHPGQLVSAFAKSNQINSNMHDDQLHLGADLFETQPISGNLPKYTVLRIWTPREINIASPQTLNNPQQQQQQQHVVEATPMQLLGNFLYSIFSQGKPPPSDIYLGGTNTAENHTGRSSKCLRSSEITVFSRLVESNIFPTSVCRFLSDMIDVGPNGKADSPFSSFEAIVQDLEQMIDEPATFLHDLHSPRGEPQLPIFGQTYHGRKDELDILIKVVSEETKGSSFGCPVDAIFVSGIAGSGKTQLVQAASGLLTSMGWVTIRSKFERGKEHASRSIVSSMFDELISHLVKLKEEGGPPDVAYSQRASNAILDVIGYDNLSLLVDFLPSLPQLFGGIFNREKTTQAEMADFQLTHFLSKIIEALSDSGWFIMICCDDLQWVDRTSMSLISELLINIGSSDVMRRRCLFVGSHREDEIDDGHPLLIQYSYLQMSSNVNTTEIKLRSLSKNDVTEMLMTDLRLPRRVVVELAAVVHKKTSGHAFFVVELLNSLVRKSTIAYSSQKCSYDWDELEIELIQTGDGVAGLIASNVESLPNLAFAQILSCFGTQTETDLLQILEKYQQGIMLSLDMFIEKGILDQAGGIFIFTHDLIQQAVYESMSMDKRRQLHLDLGRHLGSIANINATLTIDSGDGDNGQVQLEPVNDHVFFSGISMTSHLICLACDQVDCVGPEFIGDAYQKRRYAKWNLSAGEKSQYHSNYHAALYYYSKGIEFLGKDCWKNSARLCLKLHVGGALSSFSLGEFDKAIKYAESVIGRVAFKDTLVAQQVILKSLTQSRKHDECISRGIDVMRQLNFDIPLCPTKEIVMNTMASTDRIASKYSLDQIVEMCEMTIDDSAYRIVKILDAFYLACFTSLSPFLPLVACEIVKMSLKHGVCHESSTAFAIFGSYKIALDGDYAAGRYWGEIVRAISKKLNAMKKSEVFTTNNSDRQNFFPPLLLYLSNDIWFAGPREISRRILSFHQDAMNMGQFDFAMMSLGQSWRFLLYGGENLSLISKSINDRTKMIAKHSRYATQSVALDNILLVELMGPSTSLDERLCFNINDVQAEAESAKDNRFLFIIRVFSLMIAYWKGDYRAAGEHSHIASEMYPMSKMPSIHVIFFTFFRGLVAFQLYSEDGDDYRLKEGKEMMEKMAVWAQISMHVFGNKWLLLKAEYSASVHENNQAEHLYKKSISAARDNGNIHELGMSYELLGNYYLANGSKEDSTHYIKKAFLCYQRWGATVVAEKVLHDHDLDIASIVDTELQLGNSKHPRQWD